MAYFKKILLVVLFLAGWSCNDQPTCIPQQTDLVKLSFVDKDGKSKNITYTKLVVQGVASDYPALQDTSLASISLPLSPNDSVFDITFYQASDTNQLVLTYRATPIVLHPKCALEIKYDYLAIKSTDFLDATVIDSELSNQTTTNVKITH